MAEKNIKADSQRHRELALYGFRAMGWCLEAVFRYRDQGYSLSRLYDSDSGAWIELLGLKAIDLGLLNAPIIPPGDLYWPRDRKVEAGLEKWYYPKELVIWALLELGRIHEKARRSRDDRL